MIRVGNLYGKHDLQAGLRGGREGGAGTHSSHIHHSGHGERLLAIHAMDARTMKPWASHPTATQDATALRILPTPACDPDASLDPQQRRLGSVYLGPAAPRLGPRSSLDSPCCCVSVGLAAGHLFRPSTAHKL